MRLLSSASNLRRPKNTGARHRYGEIHQAFARPAPFRQGVTRLRKNGWPEGCGRCQKGGAQRHCGPAQVGGRGAARRRKTRRRQRPPCPLSVAPILPSPWERGRPARIEERAGGTPALRGGGQRGGGGRSGGERQNFGREMGLRLRRRQ